MRAIRARKLRKIAAVLYAGGYRDYDGQSLKGLYRKIKREAIK